MIHPHLINLLTLPLTPPTGAEPLPGDVIIDTFMPPMIRDSSKMWNKVETIAFACNDAKTALACLRQVTRTSMGHSKRDWEGWVTRRDG